MNVNMISPNHYITKGLLTTVDVVTSLVTKGLIFTHYLHDIEHEKPAAQMPTYLRIFPRFKLG